MAIVIRDRLVDWGVSGLVGTIAYRAVDQDGTSLVARTTAGISEFPVGSGIYHIKITTWNSAWIGREIWDDGSGLVGGYVGSDFDAIQIASGSSGSGTTVNEDNHFSLEATDIT